MKKPMIETPDVMQLPAMTNAQKAMDALNMAIMDNIVGLTDETVKNIKYLAHPYDERLCVTYKGKEILMCGCRSGMTQEGDEFYIDVKQTVKA